MLFFHNYNGLVCIYPKNIYSYIIKVADYLEQKTYSYIIKVADYLEQNNYIIKVADFLDQKT